VLFEGEVKAIIELASLQRYNAIHQDFLEQFTESMGTVLNTIEANVRTQELLKQSQSLARELQSQQEELQQTNQELQDKARLLAQQNAEVERKNSEVEQAKLALEDKAAQLALTSKYKSEFLANMSHELRTPLNSLLLLARQLSDNPNGNLLPKQVEFAHAIHASGTELLILINDILDLAKIESGTISLHMQGIALRDLCDDLERTFRPIADTKGLGFTITLDAHLPQYLQTDATRLLQILKNLLANAFKFTDKGQVALQVMLTTMGWSAHLDTLNNADMVVAFAVSDTGMGIPTDQQQLIFEAFQQADGTTSRKYGGTGLGLSISREIAHLFGGEIRLQSAMGQGSTFTFYLPQPVLGAPSWSQWQRAGEQLNATLPAPSRTVWAPLALRAQGERIRDDREQIQPGDRVVLIVENDVNFAQVLLEIVREIAWKGIVTLQGASAGALARQFKPDAITLDLLLPDIEGWTVLELLQRDPDTRHIPVHIITVMDEERERGHQQGVTSYLVKPVSKQAVHEALATSKASDPQRPGSNGRSLPPGDTLLVGKKVLIVDDDVRNLFALTSILEAQHMEILVAENGQTGIDLLQNVADVAVVLMDIMLPDMDGYDTMRAIRSVPRLSHLPIIAVTAKAMPGDREKCLEAGASDYLAKPVDTEQLLARLRAAVAGR
jgi:signal transduction histidine kinase/DNA-binding response OmpR family regulator